jgi:ABC1 atypical kinase-like domain
MRYELIPSDLEEHDLYNFLRQCLPDVSPQFVEVSENCYRCFSDSNRNSYHVKISNDFLEIEEFVSFLRLHDSIKDDPRFCLPLIIKQFSNKAVIISAWITHETTLADKILKLWISQHLKNLENVCFTFGQFLRKLEFVHNDVTPSNVLCRTGDNNFILVDCLGIEEVNVMNRENDFNGFLKSLDLMSVNFGKEFFDISTNCFKLGYSSVS